MPDETDVRDADEGGPGAEDTTPRSTRAMPWRIEPQGQADEPAGASSDSADHADDVDDIGDDADDTTEGETHGRPRLRRLLLAAAAVFGVLVLAYAVDLAVSWGEIPRGVTVAGVEIGGMEPAAAQQRLRAQLGPRLNRSITLHAGNVTTTLDPQAAGLAVDWSATIEQAADQPLNPWTRFMSLFSTREVGVVTDANRAKLTRAVRGLRAEVNHPPRPGDIRFDGTNPVPVEPKPGQRLQVADAVEAILAHWAARKPVALPVERIPAEVGSADVQQALQEVASPAVSEPVVVTGDKDSEAMLEPAVIAKALAFVPTKDGELDARLDKSVVIDALSPQLAGTETKARDAEVTVQGGSIEVIPAQKGHRIDWKKTLTDLMPVLTGTHDRTIPAVYVNTKPEFTTQEAKTLKTPTVISSFTTGGFAPDSGVNIRLVAQEVDGAVVAPGETFSLNGYTGPRTKAQGYVEAGIIMNGRPATGVGGGISQFATTLFNAAYFAGMTLIEHHEHSYYISRYPEGREATVWYGLLDVVFRNDSPTPVVIQTQWTPSSITVKFLGTKHYEVESITSERSNFTQPGTIRITHGPCIPTSGQRGFTVSNTRIVRDAQTGEIIKKTGHTTVYEPLPRVICAGSST